VRYITEANTMKAISSGLDIALPHASFG
jgi:hypothetical protein